MLSINRWRVPRCPTSSGVRYSHKLAGFPKIETISLSYEVFKHRRAPQNNTNKSILFIHGLFGNKLNYKSIAKKIHLHTGIPSYGVDLRNHGLSAHGSPVDYFHMAHDVVEFIHKHDLKELAIVGHSMGAKVAMLISLLHPELVSKLCVVDNSPTMKKLDDSLYRDFDGMVDIERSKILKSDANWLDQATKVLSNYEKDKLVQLFLLSNLTNKPKVTKSLVDFDDEYIHCRVPVEYLAKAEFLKEISGWPLSKEFQYKGDTLILKAKQSNFIDGIEEFGEYFPNNRYVELDCGHWLISEKPDEFVELFIGFMKK